MWAAAKKQWDFGKQYASDYIQTIKQEIDLAEKAAEVLQKWALSKRIIENPEQPINFSRKEIADLFGITGETVRNWERNGLISSDALGINNEKLYNNKDLERLRIVYMLRQAGYSISAIHHSISTYNSGQSNMVLTALNNPEYDELISVGDHWLHALWKLMDAAQKIPSIFNELETL
nr:MerR family transcriptional regulator [Anaerocolumna cellulosilytica]